MKNGKLAEAEKYLREAHDLMLKRFGSNDERVISAENVLNECLALQKQTKAK